MNTHLNDGIVDANILTLLPEEFERSIDLKKKMPEIK